MYNISSQGNLHSEPTKVIRGQLSNPTVQLGQNFKDALSGGSTNDFEELANRPQRKSVEIKNQQWKQKYVERAQIAHEIIKKAQRKKKVKEPMDQLQESPIHPVMEPSDDPIDLQFQPFAPMNTDEKLKTQKVQTISTNTNSGSLKRNDRKVLSKGVMAAAINHAAQKNNNIQLELMEPDLDQNFNSMQTIQGTKLNERKNKFQVRNNTAHSQDRKSVKKYESRSQKKQNFQIQVQTIGGRSSQTTSLTPIKRGNSYPSKQKPKPQRPNTMKKSEVRKPTSVLSLDRDQLLLRIESLEIQQKSYEETINVKFQKYTKNINIMIKKQIQPEIASQEIQINEINQQMYEKNEILQNLMQYQEQIIEQIQIIQTQIVQDSQKDKNNKKSLEELKKQQEKLIKQNQFQCTNIDNLQQQIESQIQLNSNIQESHQNLKDLESQYQQAIKISDEKIKQMQMKIDQINVKIVKNSGLEKVLQLESRIAEKIRVIEERLDQQENAIPQIPQSNQQGVTQEELNEKLESLRIELQVFGHDQNDIIKEQLLTQVQIMFQDRRVPNSPRRVQPLNEQQQIPAQNNENIQFDRSRLSDGGLSSSIRRSATEAQEDHPHLLAMQDSHFDQRNNSQWNHQSQNLDGDQEELHISHQRNLEINIAEAMEQIEPGEPDYMPYQQLQRQIQEMQVQLNRQQSQFQQPLNSLRETIESLEQRVLSDEHLQAQNLSQVVQIKETAQIILQNLDQIQTRVQNIENQDDQIDSSSARFSLKKLKEYIKKEMHPLHIQSEQNQLDLQTLQHLIGMIQDSNFQKQIDKLRRITSLHLRGSTNDELRANSAQNPLLDDSPNIINARNTERLRSSDLPNQMIPAEEEDIYMDREQLPRRVPHLESPQRLDNAPFRNLDLGQQLEVSPREAQLYNSIAAIESNDREPISLSAILFENQEPPIRESSVFSPVQSEQMPSASPPQNRRNSVIGNIIQYQVENDQVEEILNQIMQDEIENLLQNVISRR